jgi:hypothetical protein
MSGQIGVLNERNHEPKTVPEYSHFKDAVLDHLGKQANVAQFVSFGPRLEQRFSLVRGFEANYEFATFMEAATAILAAAPDKSVNIRSFTPESPKSREFVYGLKTTDDVAANAKRLASEGLYVILNETVDVNDGGVSGVAISNVMEFSPDDTPRCVEKPGITSLSRQMGLELLQIVYGFTPQIDYGTGIRVEFSLHPVRRGYRDSHTIIWELEDVGPSDISANLIWANNFSRKIGDKAFGLLVAHLIGLPVPATTVISRTISPFKFGLQPGTAEYWIRTCPAEQTPGLYTTKRGWIDPFNLLNDEDPNGVNIASVLAQEGVDAVYSGALISDQAGCPIIEGVRGYGDDFMLGLSAVETLPDEVTREVSILYDSAYATLGPVRMEWVYDGRRAWVVQFHRGATVSSDGVIYPGEPASFRRFETKDGIGPLRSLITEAKNNGDGIVLHGNVGLTSHFGDVLRKARIPSRIERT